MYSSFVSQNAKCFFYFPLFSSFSKSALLDVKRFQDQKVVDLRETFANFVMLQMKIARKVKFMH